MIPVYQVSRAELKSIRESIVFRGKRLYIPENQYVLFDPVKIEVTLLKEIQKT